MKKPFNFRRRVPRLLYPVGQNAPRPKAQLTKKSVLIVEPDERLRKDLEAHFKDMRLRVVCTDNVDDALISVHIIEFDFIITELTIGQSLDGFIIITSLRKLEDEREKQSDLKKRTRVIILNEVVPTDPDVCKRACDLLTDGFVGKSIRGPDYPRLDRLIINAGVL